MKILTQHIFCKSELFNPFLISSVISSKELRGSITQLFKYNVGPVVFKVELFKRIELHSKSEASASISPNGH